MARSGAPPQGIFAIISKFSTCSSNFSQNSRGGQPRHQLIIYYSEFQGVREANPHSARENFKFLQKNMDIHRKFLNIYFNVKWYSNPNAPP